MTSQQIQQITQVQGHIISTPTHQNIRSNSMYNLNKVDQINISSTKQPNNPLNTQAISFKSKPAIITSPMDSTSKLMNQNSVFGNNTFFSSTSNNINSSASKPKNQYSCQQQTIGTIQPSSISLIQGQSTLSTNRLNISIGNNTGQNTYQYNTRSRHQSYIQSFNQNIQGQGDIQKFSNALSSDTNQLKLSILAKENDSNNPLSPQSFMTSQHIKQFQSPINSGSLINQQKQFFQKQQPLIHQTSQQRQLSLQQFEKKVENPSQSQILTLNQNHQNQIQIQPQQPSNIQLQNSNQNNNINSIPPQFKDSTIQFVSSSDLENELKDLASILHREREGGLTMNTNNFLQTDRESQNQELKLEIELLKEQNEVLRNKVKDLAQIQIKYDQEQQQILLEKNLSLKKSQDENESLQSKCQQLERAYQQLQEVSSNIYGSQTPISLKALFGSQTPDMSSNIGFQDALEKKLIYLEDKIRDDEMQRSKLQLVSIKQEENITMFETMVRDAQEAQKNVEQMLIEKQYILKQKDFEIADLLSKIEAQKIEISVQKNQIETQKADYDIYLNNKETEKVKSTLKTQDEEKNSQENIELIEKIRLLELKIIQLEKELHLKQQEINIKQQEMNQKQQDINAKQVDLNQKQQELNSKQQEINLKTQELQNKQKEINKIQTEKESIERESLVLSKNTNALSDKVLYLTATLEKNSNELKQCQKKLQKQIDESQDILNQKLSNQRSNYELIITQMNEKTIGLQDQLQRVNLILDSSSINFEISQKEIIKEKNEAIDKISKLIKEEVNFQKQIEESKIIQDELKIKLRESIQNKEYLTFELDKLRNDISEQRRIFQETQKNLNTHIDQLINENNNLKQVHLQTENDQGNKLNQMIQILQQEKIQFVQDNKNIINEKITLNEKIRQLQQDNSDLLSNLYKTENKKNSEIEELKKENIHNEKSISCLKEQINTFIVEIKQFQVQLDTIKLESRLKTEQIHSQENLILNQKNQIGELIEKSYADQETGRQTGRYYYDSKFKEIEEEKQHYIDKYEKVQSNLVQQEDKLSQIIQQLNNKNEQIVSLENNISSLSKDKEQLQIENNNYYKEISKLNVEIKNVEIKMISLQQSLSDSQKIQKNFMNETNKFQYAQPNLIQDKERVIQEQQQKSKNSNNDIIAKSILPQDISFEMNQDILRLKDKLEQKQQIVDKFTNKIQQQSQKISDDEKEIQNLSQFITKGKQQYDKTIDDYQQKLDRIERQYISEQITLNNQIHLLMQDKQQMKIHLDQIQKELTEVTQYQKKTNTLPSAR